MTKSVEDFSFYLQKTTQFKMLLLFYDLLRNLKNDTNAIYWTDY